MRYLVFIIALFAALQTNAQNNIVYGAGINYTNGAPTFTPPVRTSRVAIDTVTGKWYHFNTPGGWQLIGNTIEEIAGCTAPAYTPGKGDSKVVINNCSPQPELYFYNGSAWVLVGGGSVYAGEGIRIENDTIILDSLYVLRFRTGDTTDLNAGAMSWNAGEQTLDVVINQGAVSGQMFQEVLYFTKNQTGAQIDDGTVVMAAGTTGNSGKILIAPAIADGSVNSEYILGLATQNLPNGGEGMVTHFGKVRGIQTNGANFGETWVDGDVLYCSAATPGYLTKVLPTAPNLKVPIAIVIHAHPSNGTLFVRPSHFPDLAQINDVQLSSPTNGQVLTYNATLSRWENATPANQLQTLSTDNTPGNISISSGNTITLNVNDADASTTNELQTLSAGTNTLTLSNGGGTVTVDTDPTNDVTGSGANGQVSFWTGAQTQSGDNALFWDNTNKRLAAGTNAPAARLHIVGSGTSSSTWTAQFHNSAGNNNALMIRDDGNVGIGTSAPGARLQINGSGNTATTKSFTLRNSSDLLLDVTDDGIFSYGSNAPQIRITGANGLLNNTGENLTFIARGSGINNFGTGHFNFTGFTYTATSGNNSFFTLSRQFSPTSGTAQYFYLNIAPTINQTGGANGNTVGVNVAPSLTSAADWRSYQFANNSGWGIYGLGTAKSYFAGNVAIGTTAQNASAAFEVASTTQGVLFPRMTTTQRNAIATPADGLVIYNTTDNKLQVRAAGAWVDLH